MSQALDNLKHIVVLMMSGRSFDHMLGGLKKKYPKINGLNGDETNPDANGTMVKVQPKAIYQGQLDHDPDHHFPGVDLQIYGGAPPGPGRVANMQGFIKSYATQGARGDSSHAIMNYFAPEKLNVLSTLATEYAVFNGWFSSIPGPAICNRAFAHYGTSFGSVDMNLFLVAAPNRAKIPTIYERMKQGGQSAKLYYFDQPSSAMEIVNLLEDQSLGGTYDQFIADCRSGNLPEYSFVEPNYSDHPGPGGGQLLASDQHPDHHVLAGERFIAGVYNAIRAIPDLWKSTALLITYDQHGGIYDHVVPPACTPDGYTALPAATGTGFEFKFDRLGIRVPAVLISPYIPRGTVVPGPEDPSRSRIFEHASIPATVTKQFLKGNAAGTVREQTAETFLDLLGDIMRPDNDCVFFKMSGTNAGIPSKTAVSRRRPTTSKSPKELQVHPLQQTETESLTQPDSITTKSVIAGYRSDTAATEDKDLLEIASEVEALCSVLAAKDVQPPISIGLFGDWGTGKTFFMQKMQQQFNLIQQQAQGAQKTAYCPSIVQIWFNAWHYIDANLWASLVSHIFEELANHISPKKNDPESRAQLLRELVTAKELMAEAQRDKTRAITQRDQTESQLKNLAGDRAKTEAKISSLRLPHLDKLLQSDPMLKAALEETLKSLGLPAIMGSLHDLENTLKGAYSLGGRLRTSVLSLWRSGHRVRLAFLVLIVFAGFPALTYVLRSWLPQQQFFTRTVTYWGEITILITSAASLLGKWLHKGSVYADKLEANIQSVRKVVEAQAATQGAERLALETTLNEIKAKEAGVSKQFSEAQEKVRQVEEKIKEIDEGHSLSKFILERIQTDDYRKHLGIISSVRKDFESLDKLLPAQALVNGLVPIQRIILYIDDLDRCPEDKVAEVLQAIHLLLAFKLFVVIVGVDSRWLLRSLRLKLKVFRTNEKNYEDADQIDHAHWQATPLNYLEKIFQIPFALRPMSESGFARMVANLTEQKASGGESSSHPSVALFGQGKSDDATVGGSGRPARSLDQPQTSSASVAPFNISVATVDLDPLPLQLQESERSFMSRFQPLIPSPRGTKRFVNVYRLLRATLKPSELATFVSEDGSGEYQVVQLLLAIQTGYPEYAMKIITDLFVQDQTKTWSELVRHYNQKGRKPGMRTPTRRSATDTVSQERNAESWREFLERLNRVTPDVFAQKSCAEFVKWGSRVARYSFQSVHMRRGNLPGL